MTDQEQILKKLEEIDSLVGAWMSGNSCPGQIFQAVNAIRQSIAKQGKAISYAQECELRANELLGQLEKMEDRKDAAYLERNQVVAALAKCFPSGIAKTVIEGWSEDWHGCVYIDLPTGQVSWHYRDSQAYLFAGLPRYTGLWDGHDTPEKYRRLAALELQGRGENYNWIDLQGKIRTGRD